MPKLLTKPKSNGSPHTGVFGYVGIDPGKQGGIVLLPSDGSPFPIHTHPMPDTEHDLWSLLQELGLDGGFVGCIEKVGAMPGQGVTSMFTFGQGYGRLKMALTACGVPYEDVTPQAWLKALGIPGRKKGENSTQWKDRLRSKAQQLFPGLDCWDWGIGKQRSVSDALLIAEYTRRKHEGRL